MPKHLSFNKEKHGKSTMQKAKKGTLKRIISMLFSQNKKLLIVIIIGIVIKFAK